MKTYFPQFKSAFILLIAFYFLLLSDTSFCQSLYGKSSDYEKIKESIDNIRLEYEKASNLKCPSLNILIHTPGDLIFVSSTANGETPLTKDTYFRFASNTKNITAAAILNMQEDGWLNIKNKITDTIPGTSELYVPNIPEFDIPDKNEITIEQLLQHSAGVYDIDNDTVPDCDGNSYVDYMTYKNPDHQFELAELVWAAAKNNLSYFKPGKGYHYSNTGYTILSEIIERVYTFKVNQKKVYSDYINDYLTGINTKTPIDISFPYLYTDVNLKKPNVDGIIYTKDSTTTYTKVNMSSHVGEGNGYATFSELDRYIRTLMKGESFLTPTSIELMQKSVSEHNKTYALGCFYIEDLGYGHNGCIKGYLSNMLYDPLTDVSVIIMMPVNDYSIPDEKGIVIGLKTLANAGFSARMALGFSGKKLEY